MENNQIQSMDNELLTRAILEMEIYLNSLNSRVSLTEHSNNQVLHQQTSHMNTITKMHKDLQDLKTAIGKMNVVLTVHSNRLEELRGKSSGGDSTGQATEQEDDSLPFVTRRPKV
jgi:conjugal transfer/entry exclusion protein